MDNVRFSIIENDLKWDSQTDSNFLDDNRSISSESSGDAILSEDTHTIFHRSQHFQAVWDHEEIEKSLKSSPNTENIMKQVESGHFKDLISGSNDVNVALLLSSFYGSADNVCNLLENYLANPNCTDTNGRTPLHFACCIGESQIAKILLDRGADPNRWDKENKATPLHCAASAGSVECILLLLKRKAHINVGIEKRTALHFAIEKNAIDCVETLLKYGADPNTPQVFTETPLHTACALGHKECVQLLLSYGADLRSQFGKRRLTALHLAAEDDYVDCVQLLLDNGADVDCRNADNQTPLHLACFAQCTETVELLIKYGANVNATYRDGRTALHAAIVKQSRCLECVSLLLNAGALVNKSDIYGYTPLHMAALNEYSSCAYLLIENGADITTRTNGGISALSFIVRRTPEIIPKLIAKMDSSIKVNDHEIGDVDCEIKLDFRLLVPNMDKGETELLLSFIEVGQKRILSHPLCETFLFLKWKRIRKFFLMSLFYHAVYVLMFTLYVTGVYVKHCVSDKPCKASSYASPIGYIVVFLNLALLVKEIFQMSHGLYGYAKYWENWLQWSIIFGVFLCVTPETLTSSDLFTVPDWQHHVAALVVFLVWLELMMLVGRFPIFGLYVQMFTKVAANFSKFVLAYCCLLIAFGLSFCVLFSNYPSFRSIPWGLLKTVIMMSGELEFEDIFYDNEHPIQFAGTSHILFLTFVILVTVILTNLLVGLAVSDIQGLQVSAGLDRLIRQAELVARLESLFFSKVLHKAPPKLKGLCQRSALLRTSRYQLKFITRPNDPRDKQLPEEIKMSIYKLVAERRDRNQSIKRRKREENLSIFKRSLEKEHSIEGDVKMRPKSLSTLRSKIATENSQNVGSFKKQVTRNSGDNPDISSLKEQIAELSQKLDKVNDRVLKKLHITTEELSRIKMQLDRRTIF